MLWRAHLLIGAFLVFAVFYILGTHDLVSLAMFSVFGALSALVPDLDHDSSKGRKILDSVIIVFAALAVYIGGCGGAICLPTTGKILPMAILFLAIVGAYFVLFKLFKPRHRGITHTVAANIVFGLLLYVAFGFTAALAGSLGYFSHLVADQHVKLV